MLDTTTPEGARAAERLRSEQVIWLTTVGPEGRPQSSPVWFVYDGETFLLFGQPSSWKVRNIHGNPGVSLHLDSDGRGGEIVTIEGAAEIVEGAPLAHEVPAYLEKYREGMAGIGMTPEEMGNEYGVAIRVTPLRVRVY